MNLFHRGSEFFVEVTSAKTRRTINFWLLILWLIPGSVIWFLLKDALWFVGFMSLYAIWISHWTAYSAETPVEEELEDIANHED